MRLNSSNYLNTPDLTNSSSSLPPVNKRIAIRSLGLFLLLLAGGSYLAYRQLVKPQPSPPIALVSVERTNLSITVSANGTVEPERTINVSPKSAGILKTLLVKEGDFVKAGSAIARMDDSNLQGQLTQAQGQLAVAKANLDKLVAGNRSEDIAQAKARLQTVQAALNQAEDDLKRDRELYVAGAISRQAYNKASTTKDTAQAQVIEAEQALALSQAGSRYEDITAARAQVKFAQGTLQTVQTQIDDTIILAPFSGVISRKYAEPGAFVTPMTSGSSVSSATSSSILSLAANNQVVANVAESNIAQIRMGQKVVITADAFPNKTFSGRVSQVLTQATVEQNVTSFEVEIALEGNAQNLLRSGMNVSLDFQVQQLRNAIAVPTIAIARQENVTGVYVAPFPQKPVFTPISTGVTANNRTEVKTGLTGTEKILVSPPPKSPPQSGFSWQSLLGGGRKDGSPGNPPL